MPFLLKMIPTPLSGKNHILIRLYGVKPFNVLPQEAKCKIDTENIHHLWLYIFFVYHCIASTKVFKKLNLYFGA